MASHDPSNYRFSTSTYVIMFTTLLTAYYMYALFICKLYYPNRFVPVGIPRCHRRADSRCRLRVSSTIAKLSLNCHGVLSRTLPSFRPLMGNYLPSPTRDYDPEVMPAATDF